MDNKSFKVLVTAVAASLLIIGTYKITRNKSRDKNTMAPAASESKE